MFSVAFDPRELTEHASLNQVVVWSGPDAIHGRQAEEICSRDALVGLAAEHGLTGIRPHRVADDLADAVFSGDTEIRRAAEAVVTGFGHRLGALIAHCEPRARSRPPPLSTRASCPTGSRSTASGLLVASWPRGAARASRKLLRR
ncbi:MAG: hypothetical protein ACRDRH_22730 [Pseudonocardia sp.]